jgi:hypothetical protein
MKSAIAACGFLAAVSTPVLGNEGEDLEITPELTAQWWQSVFSIPSSVHPFSQKATDPTGADYCMVGQQGETWFLGGIFKVVDISPASNQAQSGENEETTPVIITRNCEIPLGKTILIPVLNAECNTAEELALGNKVPKKLYEKTLYLSECAKTQADAVDKNTATAQFGPVNSAGKWIEKPVAVAVQRVNTVLPFSITYSPDNILSSNCGEGTEGGFLCAPDPNPSLAQADGYWAQVRPSKPGTYQLQTFGEAPEFDFALKIIYTLTVVEPNDQ